MYEKSCGDFMPLAGTRQARVFHQGMSVLHFMGSKMGKITFTTFFWAYFEAQDSIYPGFAVF
jgi:hypothetical protein